MPSFDHTPLMSGLFPGVSAAAIPFWADGRNVQFRQGGVESHLGYEVITAGTQSIRGLEQAPSGIIYAGTEFRLYSVDGGTFTELWKGLSPIINWSLIPWGDWIIANNNVDAPLVWKGSGTASTLGGLTFSKAKIMLRRGEHILAFNTSNGKNWVEWCDAEDVEEWTPTTENSAGNLPLYEIDEIVSAVALGDFIAVYSADSMQVLSYLGAPYHFGRRPVLNGVGSAGKECVVPVGRRNYGLSKNGIFVTDGTSFDYIDAPIRDWLTANFNVDSGEYVRSVHDEINQQVVWWIPTGSSTWPDTGLAFNYVHKTWTILDYGVTAALERKYYSWPIIARDTQLSYFAKGSTQGGTAQTAWIQTKPLDLEKEEWWKFLERLKFAGTFDGDLSVYLAFLEEVDETPSWVGPYTVTQAAREIYPGREGVFIVMKLSSTSRWDLTRINYVASRGGPVL